MVCQPLHWCVRNCLLRTLSCHSKTLNFPNCFIMNSRAWLIFDSTCLDQHTMLAGDVTT